MFGGLLADRFDQRKILIGFHVIAAIPAAGLALLMYLDLLSYWALIGYALMMGTVGAFIQPARDGMLNRVAGDQLQRTVTVTMGLTFGAQIFGFAAASFADSIGALLKGRVYPALFCARSMIVRPNSSLLLELC